MIDIFSFTGETARKHGRVLHRVRHKDEKCTGFIEKKKFNGVAGGAYVYVNLRFYNDELVYDKTKVFSVAVVFELPPAPEPIRVPDALVTPDEQPHDKSPWIDLVPMDIPGLERDGYVLVAFRRPQPRRLP